MVLGSQALEVGIGLALAFLAVSLILTAVREGIEARLKTRAVDLEKAIAELLQDREGTGLRGALFRHPLIAALYPGEYRRISFADPSEASPAGAGGSPQGRSPPSPARFLAGGGQQPAAEGPAPPGPSLQGPDGGGAGQPADGPPQPPPATSGPSAGVPAPLELANGFVRFFGGASAREVRDKPSYVPRELFASALLDLLRGGQTDEAAARVRRAIDALPSLNDMADSVDRLERVFEGLESVDPEVAAAARARFATLRREVGEWYDGAMDRASGWYKRRTQRILFWLGLGVAGLFNVNALVIAQALATDEELRAAMVELAGSEEVAGLVAATLPDEAAPPAPGEADAEGGTGGTPAEAAGTDEPAAAAPAPTAAPVSPPGAAEATPVPGGEAVGEEAEDSVGATDAAKGAEDDARNDAGAPSEGATEGGAERGLDVEAVASLYRSLGLAGLPVGWGEAARARLWALAPRGSLGEAWGESIGDPADHGRLAGWLFGWLALLAGYVATGFAATLGAPFWFDVLNKFMIIRSTVKPKEKSPDEPAVDGGWGGWRGPRGGR